MKFPSAGILVLFAAGLIALIWDHPAAAQQVTFSPPSPVSISCTAAAGTLVTTATLSPAPALTTSWPAAVGSGMVAATPLEGSTQIVVAPGGIPNCNTQTVSVCAGNPSGSTPVCGSLTVMSGGSIACAVGPNFSGAVPAPAQAAGFNTCVMNSDFRTAGYSSPSSWLDCAGAAAPQWFKDADGNGSTVPCSRYSMVTDSADGNAPVLQITYLPGDFVSTGNAYSAMIRTAPFNGNGIITLPNAGVTLPEQFYVEAKLRRVNFVSQTNNYFDFWSVSATPSSPYMEFDFIEMFNDTNNDSAGSNQDLSFFPEIHHANSTNIPGYDNTNYHVFGERVTMNSSGSTSVCFYVDGTQLQSIAQNGWVLAGNCATGSWPNLSELQERLVVILQDGANASGLSSPMTVNVEYVRIFGCSAWNTGGAAGGLACANTPISTNP